MKIKKICLALARWLLTGILAGAVGLNLYAWNARQLMNERLPMPFGVGMAVVLSGSMEPALSVDDLVVVHPQESYRIGDIVVYQEGRSLITHRVVEVTEEGFVTQGDANNAPDQPIPASWVKGRVTGHVPGVGKVVRALHTPVGTAVLAALAVLLLEGSFRREQKRDEDELEDIKAEIRRLRQEQQERQP